MKLISYTALKNGNYRLKTVDNHNTYRYFVGSISDNPSIFDFLLNL